MQEGKHYVRTAKAWYWNENRRIKQDWVEEVYFYMDEPWGEMAMRWYDLGGGDIAPRLEVYMQSAKALLSVSDVLSVVAEAKDGNFSPDAFCRLLKRCGFSDGTAYRYEQSYPDEQEGGE